MKILILASNPRKDLNLDDEIRLLRKAIDQSRDRDRFEVVSEPGVRVEDLQRLLLRHKPEVVHFCGHGSGEEGLIFKMDGGGEQSVRADALADMFGLNPICRHVKCVLLNACYSEKQANAIVSRIHYVVGMSHEIQDNAAIAFSKGFYLALGEGCSIDDAFEFGRNAIQLEISGSSKKMQSATAVEEVRKFEVANTIQQTAIPEHLKPILKRNPTLTQSNQDVFGSEQTLSQVEREKIQLDVATALSHTSHQSDLEVTWQRFEFNVITVNKNGEENSRTTKSAEFFTEDLGHGVPLEMIKIPPGTFQRGSTQSDDEMPQHTVTVPAFSIGKYPVTQMHWRAIATLPKVEIALNPEPSNFKGDDYPVEQISWSEAIEFCERLSRKTGHPYRLLTEAEWEYACRAGTITPFYFGETLTPKLARCKANLGMVFVTLFSGETAPVGSYFPNAFGLHDMHGNVWEWCQDHWHDSYTGAPVDGSAWITGGDSSRRVIRGGSWVNNTRYCRSSSRDRHIPNSKMDSFGFRIACSFK
jgi:formylglycine-generating enzyme required for sulfatase activity